MASVIEQCDGYVKESFPMIYNEEKEQENKINKANAELVFKPKFIPVYPELLEILTPMEVILYGFISFYTTNGNRFYFTNRQLGELLSCADETVTRLLKGLQDKGLIKTKKKMKANGGQIRFITDVSSITKLTNCHAQLTKDQLAEGQKVKEIDNKINNNNKYIVASDVDILFIRDLVSKQLSVLEDKERCSESIMRWVEYKQLNRMQAVALVETITQRNVITDKNIIMSVNTSISSGWKTLYAYDKGITKAKEKKKSIPSCPSLEDDDSVRFSLFEWIDKKSNLKKYYRENASHIPREIFYFKSRDWVEQTLSSNQS